MNRHVARLAALLLAATLAVAPAPGAAIAPVLLLMIKEIAKQAAQSMIKDALLSSLSGLGCKGIALQNALALFDLRGAAGGAGGMLAGMPKMPAGMAMPTLPAGMTMPSMPGMPAGAGFAAGALQQGAGVPPEMEAKMRALMPGAGQMPPGMAMDADQMAMMAGVMQAMSRPLSPGETLATIDELFALGFLPKAMQTELKECMVLVPAAAPALGMGMGMLKPILPKLQQARAELYALPPQEQDEVAAALVQQMKPLAPDERAALLEHIESGFFPPRIAAGVKAATAGR